MRVAQVAKKLGLPSNALGARGIWSENLRLGAIGVQMYGEPPKRR